MIDLYYWPTPNGHKISIMLEECGLEYEIQRVNIGAGDQFDPAFLAISPNNRMPAIVDRETGVSVFEGGAILIYLAEKAGMLLPTDTAGRFDVLQSADDPAQFVLYEAYDSAAEAAKHKETAHYNLWRETVADMMAQPRQGLPFRGLFPAAS